MSRWQPNAPGRLQQAAFELYTERGYDQTTVADIAARAGLTERTFFRHFADKREVLFVGGERFIAALVEPVEQAPASATTLEAVTAGIEAADSVLPAPELVARRHALILANPELQERELIKLAALATALGDALRRRSVPDTAAELAAESGVAVLRVALPRWIDDPAGRPWEVHVGEAVDELRGLTADRSVAAARS
ncbi:MAG TPA: helix-turn-helix domain-containing protein [Solirubrobacteraceae bacterium]|jgi:AcrR family transcriptional regulator|nr:helix-turn-helix domain-containing protein [Solirubrobacteraceae bacterium]